MVHWIAKLEDQPIMKHKESPGSNGAPGQSPRPRAAKKMDAILVTKLQKEGFSSSFMAPCENACLDHWHCLVQAGRIPTQEVVSAFLGKHLLPAMRSARSVD